MCFFGFRLREYIRIAGRHYGIDAVASVQPDQRTLFDVDSLPLNSCHPIFLEAKFAVTDVQQRLVLESIDSYHEELSLMRPSAEIAFSGRLLLSDDRGVADARFERGRLIDLIDNDTLHRQDVESILGRGGTDSGSYLLLKQAERALRQKDPTMLSVQDRKDLALAADLIGRWHSLQAESNRARELRWVKFWTGTGHGLGGLAVAQRDREAVIRAAIDYTSADVQGDMRHFVELGRQMRALEREVTEVSEPMRRRVTGISRGSFSEWAG